MPQLPMLDLLAIANGEVKGKTVIYPIEREIHFTPLFQSQFETTRSLLAYNGVRTTVWDHGYPNGATIRMKATNKVELAALAEVYLQHALNSLTYSAIVEDMEIRRPFKDILLRKPRSEPNLTKANQTHARFVRLAAKYNLQLR